MALENAATARILGGLWLGENYYQFDIYKHVPQMSELAKFIFQKWVEDPYKL